MVLLLFQEKNLLSPDEPYHLAGGPFRRQGARDSTYGGALVVFFISLLGARRDLARGTTEGLVSRSRLHG